MLSDILVRQYATSTMNNISPMLYTPPCNAPMQHWQKEKKQMARNMDLETLEQPANNTTVWQSPWWSS